MRPHPLYPKVVQAMQKLAPLELADRSWDNVGTLLESPGLSSNANSNRVLLTIDLTPAVAQEAIKKQANVIVAYHPFIFSGLKSITLRDPKQSALLQLVQSGISVFSPHSALDATAGGINDWLCEIIVSENNNSLSSCVPITPDTNRPEVGIGRFATLSQKMNLEQVLAAVKKGTGCPTLRLAIPDEMRGKSHSEISGLASFAVCAGSGSGVFRALRKQSPQFLLSGEMGHHDVLGWIQKGVIVILTEHTNTERGYLPRLQKKLNENLGNDVEIFCSEIDADPLVSV